MKYKLRTVASYLPQPMLGWLHRKWPVDLDTSDGWTFWMDASYEQWCRQDLRANPDSEAHK
jgi:hypothetical protein